MKKKTLLQVITIMSFTLTACEDAKLAKEASGTWETTLNLKDEYGTPYDQHQTYTFQYIEDDMKDGGTLIECTETTLTEESDDIEVTYTAKTSIQGKYELIWGDLYITYNLSSLDVVISNVSYKISDTADLSTQLDYAQAAIGMALLGQELINKDELAEEIRKNAYKSFYETYEASNEEDEEGACYKEVKIENGTMSFVTSDVGRMHLKKVNSNIPASK